MGFLHSFVKAGDMNTLFIVLSVLTLSVGLALLFVGSLVSLITAFGNRQWYWGIGMLCFLPLSIVYCWVQGDIAAWPRKLVSIGGALFLVGAVVLVFPQVGLK